MKAYRILYNNGHLGGYLHDRTLAETVAKYLAANKEKYPVAIISVRKRWKQLAIEF